MHACVCTKQESSSPSLQVVHYTMGERTGTLDTICCCGSSEQTSTGHSDETHGAWKHLQGESKKTGISNNGNCNFLAYGCFVEQNWRKETPLKIKFYFHDTIILPIKTFSKAWKWHWFDFEIPVFFDSPCSFMHSDESLGSVEWRGCTTYYTRAIHELFLSMK